MKRILVADDSVTIQKVIALTFADEPFEVKSVGTGTEAMELLSSWKPDIVLADVIMPQMNGYELCRAVKEHPETSSVPVLLLAGTFEAFDEEEAGAVGADDYITKPFESGELIGKVRSLTEEEASSEAAAEAPVEGEEEDASGISPPVEEQTPEEVLEVIPVEPVPPSQGPPVPAAPVESSEPDIWDILSEVEDLSPAASSGSETGGVSGLNPLEEKGVIDVGSFDVGLDRPEPQVRLPEAGFEKQTAPPPQPPGTGDAAPEEPPAPEAWAFGEFPSPVESADGVQDRSTVENREKDFFGFEVDDLEGPSAQDAMEDAVEEITFDLEGTGQEVNEPIPGEAFAGEEPFSREAPTPSGSLPEPAPEFAGISFSDDISEPFSQEIEHPDEWMTTPETAEEIPSPPVSGPSTGTSSGEGFAEEGPEESEPPLELDLKEAFPEEAAAPPVLDEARIREIIEEKVEKVVWEVVPELAEIMIREAIEKIRGGS